MYIYKILIIILLNINSFKSIHFRMINNNEIQYEKLVIDKNNYKCDESINCFDEFFIPNI